MYLPPIVFVAAFKIFKMLRLRVNKPANQVSEEILKVHTNKCMK